MSFLLVSKHSDNRSVSVHAEVTDHKLAFFKCDMSACHSNPVDLNVYWDIGRADDESIIDELEHGYHGFDRGTEGY